MHACEAKVKEKQARHMHVLVVVWDKGIGRNETFLFFSFLEEKLGIGTENLGPKAGGTNVSGKNKKSQGNVRLVAGPRHRHLRPEGGGCFLSFVSLTTLFFGSSVSPPILALSQNKSVAVPQRSRTILLLFLGSQILYFPSLY